MSDRRTAAKLMRFHPEELAHITARAQACGRASGRFMISSTALGATPKPEHHAAREEP